MDWMALALLVNAGLILTGALVILFGPASFVALWHGLKGLSGPGRLWLGLVASFCILVGVRTAHGEFQPIESLLMLAVLAVLVAVWALWDFRRPQ